jgi:hypothetical protein
MVVIYDATSATPLPEKCIAARDITFSNAAALPGWTFRQRQVTFLNIEDSVQLTEITEEVGALSALHFLRIKTCPALTRLPAGLADLICLTRLRILHTGITCLPDSIGQLSSLTELNITACPIQRLPPTFGDLALLQWLVICLCNQLDTIPDSIGQCRSLRHFTLLRAPVTRLPLSMSALLPRLDFQFDGYAGLVSPLVRSLHELRCYFIIRQNILILIVAGRRSRRRRLPAELWALIMSDFFVKYTQVQTSTLLENLLRMSADATRARRRATSSAGLAGPADRPGFPVVRRRARVASARSNMFLLTFCVGSNTKRQQKHVGSSTVCWIRHKTSTKTCWIQHKTSTKTCWIRHV